MYQEPCFFHHIHGFCGCVKACRMTTQIAIGVVAAAIQCHIDPSGRVCAEPLNGFFIYQSAVGVDCDRHAQSFHFCINLPKILSEKGLTAGEQQEKHPLLGTASPQIDPLCRGELLLFPILGHLYIAHSTTHIAPRRQLKGAADGHSGGGSFAV